VGISGFFVPILAQASEVPPATPTIASPTTAIAAVEPVSHRSQDLLPATPDVLKSPLSPVANVYPEQDVIPEFQTSAFQSSALSTITPDGDRANLQENLQLRQPASSLESSQPLSTSPIGVSIAQLPAPNAASPSVTDPGRTQQIDQTTPPPQPDGKPLGTPPLPLEPESTSPTPVPSESGQEEVEEEGSDANDLPGSVVPIIPRPPAPKPPKAKWLFLSGRLDYFNSGNVFAASDRLQDSLIRTGATLSVFPKLGSGTYFLGAVDGNLIRYGKYGKSPDALNYDELRLRAGILQQLSPRMYGEIGWTNQKLFTAEDGLRNILSGDRFLNENSLRVELSRTDPITPKLSLSTYYQFRWSTSNRSDNDRLSHSVFAALNYKLSPSWNTGLDYFISWSNYTNVNRDDVYQQVQLRTGYNVNRNVQLNLFGGYSFGGSTDDRPVFGRSPAPGLNPNSRLQYDAWFFGVNLVLSTPLL
jgi:hypothetical protein